MDHRRVLFATTVSAWLSFCASAVANLSTIAVSGDDAIGVASAQWNQLGPVSLNNSGAVAFGGTLEHGGSITAANDAGVWMFDSSVELLLAQTGSSVVPGVSGAQFETLEVPQLGDSGDIVLGGTLVVSGNGVTSNNNHGVWRYDNTSGTLVARTGSGDVPGVLSADYVRFTSAVGPAIVALADDGDIAFVADLAIGVGGVTSNNNRGVWRYSETSGEMMAREETGNVPDVPAANFRSFDLPAVNANGQLVMLASLEAGGSGIWRYTGASGELLSRTGNGGVTGVAGVDFVAFDETHLNNTGQAVFGASLSNGDDGIWSYAGATGSLLALTSAGGVPDVTGANFAGVAAESINDAGQVLVAADLEIGVGDVGAGDEIGLWLLGTDNALVARSGSGGVPGVQNANFLEFNTTALNANGVVAFVADLQMEAGDVDSTNDSGIWIVDPAGDSWLVAREGDQLAGRTIAALDFVGDGPSQASGFNDFGELAFQATFTDGDNGLFLFRPYAADFDRDNDVDSADLTEWQTAYMTSSVADADGDDDSDGTDFLVWQREFGSGVPPAPITNSVPEPTSWLLLLMGIPALLINRSRCYATSTARLRPAARHALPTRSSDHWQRGPACHRPALFAAGQAES